VGRAGCLGWDGVALHGMASTVDIRPYPVYPSARIWLTDYLISANLQAAYAAQAESQRSRSRRRRRWRRGNADQGGGDQSAAASNSAPSLSLLK